MTTRELISEDDYHRVYRVFGDSGEEIGTDEETKPTPEQVNERTIEDRLRADLVAVDAVLGTVALSVTGSTVAEVRSSAQTALRDLQRQVKDMARMNKRLARVLLRAFDATE